MAGTRVTSSTTTGAQQVVQINGTYPMVEVVNWGTATLFAVARTSADTVVPTLVWAADDVDVIPAGSAVTIPVSGPAFDQGNAESSPVINIYVLSQAAGQPFTLNGSNG